MKKSMDEIKQQMKNEYAKKVDEYFSQYDKIKTEDKVNINNIESLLGYGMASAKEVLINATEEILKPELKKESDAESKKKRVPPAENQ